MNSNPSKLEHSASLSEREGTHEALEAAALQLLEAAHQWRELADALGPSRLDLYRRAQRCSLRAAKALGRMAELDNAMATLTAQAEVQ